MRREPGRTFEPGRRGSTPVAPNRRRPTVRPRPFLLVVWLVVLVAGTELLPWRVVWAAMPGRVGPPAATWLVPMRDARKQPDARLAVLGDVGTGDADELAIAHLVARTGASDPFDALVLLGDNVYPDGDPDRLAATVFGPFGPVLGAGAELLAVLGNHDVIDGHGPGQVAALGMPGRWYAATVGEVSFIALDSTKPEDRAQLDWLEATLAEEDRWTVVALHHPPFSAGYHGSDEEVRESFVPLFERYGVDLVLAGHDHDYQRSVPIGGVTYVVSGGGATVRPTGAAGFTAASASVLHFLDVGVWNDRIELRAISRDGVFDEVTVLDNPAMATVGTLHGGDRPSGRFDADGGAPPGFVLAGAGGLLWLAVLAVGWWSPGTIGVRIERLLISASTVSVAALLAGIGRFAASVVA